MDIFKLMDSVLYDDYQLSNKEKKGLVDKIMENDVGSGDFSIVKIDDYENLENQTDKNLSLILYWQYFLDAVHFFNSNNRQPNNIYYEYLLKQKKDKNI